MLTVHSVEEHAPHRHEVDDHHGKEEGPKDGVEDEEESLAPHVGDEELGDGLAVARRRDAADVRPRAGGGAVAEVRLPHVSFLSRRLKKNIILYI